MPIFNNIVGKMNEIIEQYKEYDKLIKNYEYRISHAKCLTCGKERKYGLFCNPDCEHKWKEELHRARLITLGNRYWKVMMGLSEKYQELKDELRKELKDESA